ncbi:MAG TPA: PH domain-containing protein [Actinomycetota bacterium]|nr:PH domain-containing protein [Actinomycetota bacterium]
MPFPRRLLIEGEELVLDRRPHWIALVGPALVAIVGLIAAWWLATRWLDDVAWLPWIAYLVLLVVYPVPKVVAWLTSNFAVTSDRVIHREGFIAKRSMEIPLEAINDVRFDQGVIDRMLGAGTLVIQSASEQGRQIFDDIRDPEGVQRTIYREGERNKERMFQGRGDAAPAAPSVTSELERLADLRAKGILTEEEFQAQKARILRSG